MCYLQITTKCNFKCAHCCYSCTMRGKHGDYHTILDAISFARSRDDSTISIGGGEPTLHPDFFKILKHCVEDFCYVWLATNGSQTKAMRRLCNIIEGCDFESFDREDYCSCECACVTEEEKDNCRCFDERYCEPIGLIYQENKLSVALSQDCFHDPIDPWVVRTWASKAQRHSYSHYEIRDVTRSHSGVAAVGRAKKTGAGSSDHCVCSNIFIRPDGKIKLCGCARSPIIGDVWEGITEKWEDVINNDDGYRDINCYKGVKNGKN